MKQLWETKLTESGVNAVKEILDQLPEGLVRDAYISILNKIAAPDRKTQLSLEKLAALEAAGVDSWEGYDEALEGFTDEEDEDESDE